MAFPKILLCVPLLVAGTLLPAAGSALHSPPVGTIGMTHEGYSVMKVTIHRGERLRFQNSSRFIHIIGPGKGGHLAPPGMEPVKDRVMVQSNESYTTGPWTHPGTYYMTCSVHPEMDLTIVVLDH